MPKNKGKGGKNIKKGKKTKQTTINENCQEYAKVLSIDGVIRLCHIRGKLHKKVWINAGDIVLVGLRDYETDKKADVILRFMPDEARFLMMFYLTKGLLVKKNMKVMSYNWNLPVNKIQLHVLYLPTS